MSVKQLAPLLIVSLLLIGAGTYYQGIHSERWQVMDSALLDDFARRVELVPKEFGRWVGVDDQEISEEEWKATNCKAYVSRTYEHQDTGEKVSFYLVAGTARHITIHTPDWCYVGAGFAQQGATQQHQVSVADKPAEFATAVFSKPDAALRIYWTYSDDGTWLGPSNPNFAKMKFGGRPAMYKIYLIGVATETPDEGPCPKFAKDVFGTLDGILFQGESDASATSSDLDV